MRILYLHPGPTPPSTNPSRNEFAALSAAGLEGDLAAAIWQANGENREEHVRAIRRACGKFDYHCLTETSHTGPIRSLRLLWFFVTTGMRLHREKGAYDAIVSYSTFTPGVAAYVLKLLTGARFIPVIPGALTARAEALGRFGMAARVKHWLALRVSRFLLQRADGVKLLYEGQLGDLPRPRRSAVFHAYVPVSDLETIELSKKENVILFMGFPWHLKGVDVLIKAFLKIADQVPEYELKIVGHCPDRSAFEALAGGHRRIRFMKAVYPDEAKELIRHARLFVLPSRTEAMGRVLLEAMAGGTPVVASRVDGIPTVVEHGVNGLLFERENVDELAAAIVQALTDRALAERLAANAGERVQREFSEERHAAQLADFVTLVCSNAPPVGAPRAVRGIASP